MLHKINLPDCAPQLKQLTKIAEQVVIFALSNDLSILNEYTWDGSECKNLMDCLGDKFIRNHGGPALPAAVKECFLAHFTNWGRPRVGEWLWGKWASIAAPVVKLIVLPPQLKTEVLRAFQHDIDFEALSGDNGDKVFHTFQLSDATKPVTVLLKELLVNFYGKIFVSQGIPTEVLEEEKSLDHQTILQSYHQANLHLKVCPGCDGKSPLSSKPTLPPDRSSDNDLWFYANIDHFLPKSKYAFLAVHPYNLVPLCLECNQTRKREKDALETPGVANLDDIYHPYIRAACNEIKVTIEHDPIDGQACIKFSTNTNNPRAIARLQSLNHIFELESYWTGDLRSKQFEADIKLTFSCMVYNELKDNKQYNDDWIRNKFRIISKNLQFFIGDKPHAIAHSAFASWIADDNQAYIDYGLPMSKALGIRIGSINPLDKRIQPQPVD
jgi:hypothetical protein